MEAARYAAPGETGYFFPQARVGQTVAAGATRRPNGRRWSDDRWADAPFTILKTWKGNFKSFNLATLLGEQ